MPFREATFGQLIRAAEAGTLDGDPLRFYLILLGPQGNGMLATWSGVLESLSIIWRLLETAATLEGARSFARNVLEAARQRVGSGRDAIHENYLDWSERGARPDNFADLQGLGPWHGEDLAERLGCSSDEAKAILWAYGYTPAPSGLWRRGGDEAEDDEPLEVGPIEGLKVRCQCGRDDCEVEAQFYRGGPSLNALVVRFDRDTDHFAVAPAVLGAVIGTLAR